MNQEFLPYFAILNAVICDLKLDSLEKDIMQVGLLKYHHIVSDSRAY